MQISAELRWFWPDQCPDNVRAWFTAPEWVIAPAEPEERIDRYFPQPGNCEIGCKLRDAGRHSCAQAELKGLVACLEGSHIEIWSKWDWIVPPDHVGIDVTKRRQVRIVCPDGSGKTILCVDGASRPDIGEPYCQIELTEVRVGCDARVWWTLGVEATGSLLMAPVLLTRVMERNFPPTRHGWRCSYPRFLEAIGT